jgi:hypothetical protein
VVVVLVTGAALAAPLPSPENGIEVEMDVDEVGFALLVPPKRLVVTGATFDAGAGVLEVLLGCGFDNGKLVVGGFWENRVEEVFAVVDVPPNSPPDV